MGQYWVMAADGQFYGPVDEAGLTQWTREGRVGPQTQIRCETGQTVWAGSLAFLSGALSAPPGPPQPQAVQGPAYYNQVVPANSPLARMHQLESFSTAGAVLLHYATFGIFTTIWFGLQHDKMPRLRHDDPSAGKAIGFMFIPFFNLYWLFFMWLRLCDRIIEQRQLRGLPAGVPRGLVLAACVCTLIPYVNVLVAGPILWPIAVGMLQGSINELAMVTAAELADQQAYAQPG